MRVSVKCYATLSGYQPGSGALEIEEGHRLEEVLDRLGLTKDQVKVAFVNGRHAPLDRSLAEGDQIALFPTVGGG